MNAIARRQLFADGARVWTEFERRHPGASHPFVPADYESAHEALAGLREHADSFVELGSGNGVITVLADRLGYDAYGIEIQPWLVEQARELAARHGSRAEFACGSFVPHGFDRCELQSADFPTVTGDGPPAWDGLGLALRDFDLIYLFPWPGEEDLHLAMLREHARTGALYLSYSATDGFVAQRL